MDQPKVITIFLKHLDENDTRGKIIRKKLKTKHQENVIGYCDGNKMKNDRYLYGIFDLWYTRHCTSFKKKYI